MGPPANGCTTADLIDQVLASGPNSSKKSGYTFSYVANDADGDGKMDTYKINADPNTPGVTGTRFFFTDQSGVIRANVSTQASASDPPIS
ncbi:MAG: hypothetical protein K6U02_07615, partial [Firmicutes bacterium]|nr:hypothetical protein [Bacillota bacterium]